jgi:hypothetical protein
MGLGGGPLKPPVAGDVSAFRRAAPRRPGRPRPAGEATPRASSYPPVTPKASVLVVIEGVECHSVARSVLAGRCPEASPRGPSTTLCRRDAQRSGERT